MGNGVGAAHGAAATAGMGNGVGAGHGAAARAGMGNGVGAAHGAAARAGMVKSRHRNENYGLYSEHKGGQDGGRIGFGG